MKFAPIPPVVPTYRIDLPSRLVERWAHVRALQEAVQRRQGAPLLERGGERARERRARWCSAKCVVSGRDQRQPACGVVPLGRGSGGGATLPSRWRCFPEDREAPELDCEVVQVRLAELTLHAPRQWGACLAGADTVGASRAGPSSGGRVCRRGREGTRWLDILKVQVCYRLIDPGSDWRLHRHWYEHSALRDLARMRPGDCQHHVVSVPGQAGGAQAGVLHVLARRVGRRCSTRVSTSCSTI